MTENATVRRTYPAAPEEIWRLWTTSEGIGQWWAPQGFVNEVQTLELRPGGTLVYTMTATGPEQIEFMNGAGLPLSTQSRKTFTEADPPRRSAHLPPHDLRPS